VGRKQADRSLYGAAPPWAASLLSGVPAPVAERMARAILEVCAASTGHVPVTEALRAANPPPAGEDGRTREYKAWTERQIEGFGIVLDLVDGGSLRTVEEPCGEDGECPWGVTITDAGRAGLAVAS